MSKLREVNAISCVMTAAKNPLIGKSATSSAEMIRIPTTESATRIFLLKTKNVKI